MSGPALVVDTNVVVSGLITSDATAPTARILDAMLRGELRFLLSEELLSEYRSVLLRPKIAAQKSKVLNFYWMVVGLVTGVYTFGIVGVLLGPMVIGLLKAIVVTITSTTSWRLLDDEDAPAGTTAERPA